MGKFSQGASPGQAQLKELQELATVGLPTGPAEVAPETTQERPAAAPSLDALLSPQGPAEAGPEATPGLQEGTDDLIGLGAGAAQDVETQRIPSLMERGKGGGKPARWIAAEKEKTSNNPVVSSSATSDGGMIQRGKDMVNAARNDGLYLNMRPTGPAYTAFQEGVPQEQIADGIAEEKEGSLNGALMRANAVEVTEAGKYIPNEMYTRVAAATTENMLMQAAAGEHTETSADPDPIASALGDTDPDIKAPRETRNLPITKAQGNKRLGKAIHAEYMRTQGDTAPEPLPDKEAETLGDAFKELWAAQNDKLITRVTNLKTNQVEFQLTPLGAQVLKEGKADRAKLFPSANVRPVKTPPAKGKLPGDTGKNVVKSSSGAVGKTDFGSVLKQATENMSSIPNVVDKQRGKILLATILPVLRDGDHGSWQAEINNIGDSKVKKFNAAERDQGIRREEAAAEGRTFKELPYDPIENMDALVSKVAQEVRAVAMERNGANYLTYGIQAFNGRIAPQQSYFDPTSSKTVRFVTRNASPALAKKGNRVEKNLRQMYAMTLVPALSTLATKENPSWQKFDKADLDLPALRETKLQAATPKLLAWAKRIEETMTMTDEQYEAVSQAIADGMALTDPNFPQFGGLDLDPVKDEALIKAIREKGEDGPHFIDGLLDFKKYDQAMKAGGQYGSYYNAYIDGKVNGLAANGMQMGHIPTAERTGVLRDSKRTLLDDGDPRDALQDILLDMVSEDGWSGMEELDGMAAEMTEVSNAVYSTRALNKATTMTFGYGKEIDSFKYNIKDTLSLLQESIKPGLPFHSALATLDSKFTRDEIADMLNGKYGTALTQVMSDDAIQSRGLMRSAAMLHAATNSLFKIKSYIGNDLHLGSTVATGETESMNQYSLETPGKTERPTARHYETEATSTAPRTRTDKKTGERTAQAGEYAWGGSIPGPVQSLDAATVAMTATNKSWQKLKDASQGKPYMHTIYDAFKMDANGYDVILEEVNKNWAEASLNWSYLEQTQAATKQTMKDFWDELKTRDPKEEVKPNERLYMDYLFETNITDKGKPDLKGLRARFGKLKDLGSPPWDWQTGIVQRMKAVGYDPYKKPEKVTVRMYKEFIEMIEDELNFNSKISAMVSKTNNNKKRLKQELAKRGHKTKSGERIPLQYFSH